MKNVGNSSRGHSQGVTKIFRAPRYRVHCAVIFAIAQLFYIHYKPMCPSFQLCQACYRIRLLDHQLFLFGDNWSFTSINNLPWVPFWNISTVLKWRNVLNEYSKSSPSHLQSSQRYSSLVSLRSGLSATGHPIHFMFGSSVCLSGSAERMALFYYFRLDRIQ